MSVATHTLTNRRTRIATAAVAAAAVTASFALAQVVDERGAGSSAQAATRVGRHEDLAANKARSIRALGEARVRPAPPARIGDVEANKARSARSRVA